MSELDWWFVHEVDVRTIKPGTGAYGDQFEDVELAVPVYIEDDSRILINSDGNQIVSSGAVFGDLVNVDKFKLGSMVTLRPGEPERRVIQLDRPDSTKLGGLGYFEAYLS